jgi:hypothetical protein
MLSVCGLAAVSTVEPHVRITYDNRTDSVLCLYAGTASAPRGAELGSCLAAIEADGRTT